MKWIAKRLSPIVLALALLVAVTTPAVSAAQVVLEPGEKTTFFLEYTDARAVEGELLCSNGDIVDITYDITGSGMKGLAENGLIFLYSDEVAGVSGKVEITVTLRSDVPEDAFCEVVIRYAVTAAGSNKPGETQTVSHAVWVRDTSPSAPSSTPTTPTTAVPNPSVDTKALRAQIEIAQGLTYYDYTNDTWAKVETALKAAHNCLGSDSQGEVDSAAEALKTALKNLKKMDYSALQKALDSVKDIDQHEDLTGVWNRFVEALKNARIQRTGGDQAAVDKATAELLASKAALQEALEQMGDIITNEPVVVPPEEPFCNKDGHVWQLIFMIASLGVNAALIAFIVIYFLRKNHVQRDTTPLVTYDIDDDFELPEDDR